MAPTTLQPERPDAQGAPAPVLGRTWWGPLVFVALSLAVLLVVPVVLNQQVNRRRGELDRYDRARVLINDLESAAATEALIAARRAPGRQPVVREDSIAAAAAYAASVDEYSLDSLFRRRDTLLVEQLDTIARIERAWRPPAAHTASAPDPTILITSAEHLDDRLARVQDAARKESRSVQNITILLLVALTPCALLSVAVVFWGGRRYVGVAHSLEAERAALAQALETRAALLRGITHDVKNPLGAAAGYADLLTSGMNGDPLAPQHLATVRRIRKLINDSLETIGEMLQLERGQPWMTASGKRQLVDVGAIASDLVEDYRAAANEKSLAITLDVADAPVVVASVATHVQHIIGNLLSNAVKYTPARGLIRVRVARRSENHGSPDIVLVEVRDSGTGIAPELRERVFDEFYRADAAPRIAPGHGVGLAISRRLARMLGGDVSVTAAPEGGANFTLTLPAASPGEKA